MGKGDFLGGAAPYIIGIGAVVLLWKSNFFENISKGIGSGINDIGEGLGGGLYNIGSGVNNLGYGLGGGLYNIGSGVDKLGGGLYQIGTGAGTLLGGTAPANMIQSLKDNPQYYQLPQIYTSTGQMQTPIPQNKITMTKTQTQNKVLSTKQQIIQNVPILKVANQISPLVNPAVSTAIAVTNTAKSTQNSLNQYLANQIATTYNNYKNFFGRIF